MGEIMQRKKSLALSRRTYLMGERKGKGVARKKTYTHEDGICPPSRPVLAKHIRQDPRDNGDWCSSTSTAEHSKDQKRLPAGGEGTGQREQGEEGKRRDGQVASTKVLCERTPDQRAEDVADQEDADGQDVFRGRRYAKLGRDAWDGHARKGRRHGRVEDQHDCDEDYEGFLELFGVRLARGGGGLNLGASMCDLRHGASPSSSTYR